MIIAFFNQKGGVCKTGTSLLLRDYLEKLNKRVLLIDLDPQGSLTKNFLSRSERINKPSLSNFIMDKIPLSEVIRHIDNYTSILPASISMATAPEIDSTMLINYRDRIKLIAQKFDYVIADCPPSLSVFSRLGLLLADKLFMPVEASDDSLDALGDAITMINAIKILNPAISDFKVFETRSKKNRSVDASARERFRSELGDKWINNVSIPDVTAYKERLVTKENFFDMVNKPEINNFFDHLYNKEILNG